MQYFQIAAIKAAIGHLEGIRANWLLPSFVFAANGVDEDEYVDLAKTLGTDRFLDRYFNGSTLGIAPFPTGNNLLRPRFLDMKRPYPDDYLIRQDTKMWGNLFSSRGYREMKLEGLLTGERTTVALTTAFGPRFAQEIPASFRFEEFLVWLFAFDGFPDEISDWSSLYQHLLDDQLHLDSFAAPYRTRFKLSDPALPWPTTLAERPADSTYLSELAPGLQAALTAPEDPPADHPSQTESVIKLPADDLVLNTVQDAIRREESLAFLFTGPPGTGKTWTARRLATTLVDGDDNRVLYLQFHPTLSYDDFMEGYRPVQADGGLGVSYRIETRLFLDFATIAKDGAPANFVVVIDELNRGDVARVFGEVLTYIEPDYRDVEFTLPLSGKRRVLPRNLLIVATANPHDRSVTDLDDAVLRRFWVIEMEPDRAFLGTHLREHNVDPGLVQRTIDLFDILNKAFPNGYGHTSFLRVRRLEDLVAIWDGRIRLALRRARMHEREQHELVVREVEDLLFERSSEAED